MGPRPGRSSAAAEAPPIICAVCLENVAADRVCTPCAHVFCRSCYTDWAAQNATCPTCRTSLVLPSGRVAGLMLEMDAEHAARSGAYQRRVALERRLDEYQASVFTGERTPRLAQPTCACPGSERAAPGRSEWAAVPRASCREPWRAEADLQPEPPRGDGHDVGVRLAARLCHPLRTGMTPAVVRGGERVPRHLASAARRVGVLRRRAPTLLSCRAVTAAPGAWRACRRPRWLVRVLLLYSDERVRPARAESRQRSPMRSPG